MWNASETPDGEEVPLTADFGEGPSTPHELGDESEDTYGKSSGDGSPDDTTNQKKKRSNGGLKKLDASKSSLNLDDENHSDIELDSLHSAGADSLDQFLPELDEENTSGRASRDLADDQILSAVIPNQDDPTLPTLTFRFWVLGSILTVLSAAVGQFYYFRSATLSLSLFFVQLVSFVLGNAMAHWLPIKTVRILGLEFTLNDGPFNVKEHTLIVICASTSLGVAYAIDILAVQRLFYGTDIGAIGSISLLITTQCLGYGFAGMLRTWLVEKKEMVWPGNLPIIALFNTLHGKDETGPSHAKSTENAERRMNFFSTVFFAAILYGFLPSYIAPTLTSIAFMCLLGGGPAGTISKTVAQLGSGYQGAGLLTLTLDWNYIGIVGPLYTPLWSQVNYIVSAIFFAWVITPIIYHADLWNAKTFPMFGTSSYGVDGGKWNVTQVLHPNLTLNEAAYEQNPIRLSTFWALMYGISFLNLTAVVVHVYLYHGSEIWERFRASREEMKPDIHTLMMRVYKDVPNSVFLGIFFSMLALSVLVVEWYDLQLPWWGVLLAVATAAIFVLPVGILQAVSNQQVGLNVLTEFIAGVLFPGQPIANIVFKTCGLRWNRVSVVSRSD